MMLDDLRVLLAHVPEQALRADYAAAVIESNLLGKPTRKSRELSFRHLASLYGLDTANPIFRNMRRLWPINSAAQPLLALAVALARDPLLRCTQEFVLALSPGTSVIRDDFEKILSTENPDRFSPASLKSFAQNVAGSWTSAGFFVGTQRKTRSSPDPQPESAALLLFLSYLEGRTGERLFAADWTRLLEVPLETVASLASTASRRGLLNYMSAGGITDIRFTGYLTPSEEQNRLKISHDF